MSFEKGDIVVCVDDQNITDGFPKLLIGATYVIRSIAEHQTGKEIPKTVMPLKTFRWTND